MCILFVFGCQDGRRCFSDGRHYSGSACIGIRSGRFICLMR
ncbi:hypothetical protein NEIELOOT_02058 [Neisseria elongata subsp. glycolytica ATCC 29315]|uniref:Uncharacterized protein n=1 Tax=Neisseria elongata subsp. glycolytica ATCC 29315 TaxID=546263 RepID=D4DSL4_NEIEG|nr:hypothetical protein NEIELOOT_02058 [Neisseria elongata subsp. glycolytica ATCC 29315]